MLLIEDEADSVDSFRELTRIAEPDMTFEFEVAPSLEEALAAISSGEFDFVVCDLRIPSGPNSLDADVQHGFLAHERLCRLCPGTPSAILTGHGSEQAAAQTVEQGQKIDMFGDGEQRSTSAYFRKTHIKECIEYMVALGGRLNELDAMPTEGDEFTPPSLLRGLKAYARQRGAAAISVRRIKGGLSSATPITAELLSSSDGSLGKVFCKIDDAGELEAQAERYQDCVLPTLPPGAFPALGPLVRAPTGRNSTAVYSLARDFERNLLDLLSEDDRLAAAAVRRAREFTDGWRAAATSEQTSLGELRRTWIEDDELADLDSLRPATEFEEYESGSVELSWCCQHGDLHGANVLIDADGDPLLIDFGDVGRWPAGVDPVNLELSMYYHPDSPYRRQVPEPRVGEAWYDLEAYAAQVPRPEFVTACREWATELTGGGAPLRALAYVHSVRQLKYSDAPHDFALSVARSCASL